VCDGLGNYLVASRCAGESSYSFKPISRISKVRGCNNPNSLDHPHSELQKVRTLACHISFC